MLKENRIQFYSKWQAYWLGDEEFIDFSPACLSEASLLGQFTDLAKKPNADSLAFLAHSQVILQVILVGLLVASLSVFCLFNFDRFVNRIPLKWHTLYHKLSAFFFSTDRPPTKLNVLFICFLIFLYINLGILVSSIKTNR